MYKTLKPYSLLIGLLFVFSVGTNILFLYFPKKLGEFIDAYQNASSFEWQHAVWVLGGLTLIILILALLQYAFASFVSEKVGKDIRKQLISAIKKQSWGYIRETTSSKLITNLTSDVDAVKNLVSQGIVSILTAVLTLIGTVIFLLTINWKLALATLSIVPFIMVVFALVFRRLGALFGASQENLDVINKTINESIIASPLVRVLHAESFELQKFDVANKTGTDISKQVVTFFSILIPVITMLSNIAILIVLYYGGIQVSQGTMSLGQMTAFFSYTSAFIWPFFFLSFAGTFVSRAQVSLKRINEVLNYKNDSKVIAQNQPTSVTGSIEFKNVTLKYGEKEILKNISFEIKPHTKTAIVGPTGAGKTELFYLMSGLATPTEGEILIDGIRTDQWDQSFLLAHIGLVFQDSIIFNTSLKENILFNSKADEQALGMAVETSDLSGLVEKLPEGYATNIAERGTTLSGGQKQRVMLARALALKPTILLLDDFTARVDAGTEKRILDNIQKNFSGITLVSITQKIEPIKEYDEIIVLMEGELLAHGKHDVLLRDSLEYRQIFESQQSTEQETHH